jgi:dihydroxyacetone kinase
MPGFSLTLLLLPTSSSDFAPPSDVILRLLDASTSAPGWKWTSGAPPSAPSAPPPAVPPSERAADQGQRVRAHDVRGFERSVERACNALDKAEPEITKMDTVAGDGDCGLTLQTGANGTPATPDVSPATTLYASIMQPCSRFSAQVRSVVTMSLAL